MRSSGRGILAAIRLWLYSRLFKQITHISRRMGFCTKIWHLMTNSNLLCLRKWYVYALFDHYKRYLSPGWMAMGFARTLSEPLQLRCGKPTIRRAFPILLG